MSGLSQTALIELRRRIVAELRSHESSVSDLKAALADVDAAERLLRRMECSEKSQVSIGLRDFTELPYDDRNPFRQGSIRAIVWEVLIASPDTWMTTEDVRREASKIMGRPLAANSVGVALSRMKPRIMRRGLQVAESIRAIDDQT